MGKYLEIFTEFLHEIIQCARTCMMKHNQYFMNIKVSFVKHVQKHNTYMYYVSVHVCVHAVCAS